MADSNYWTYLGQHRVTRRSVLRGTLVGGVGLAGAALIGCGSSRGKPAATTSGSPAAAAGKSAAETPVVSDAFVALQTRDAVSLDPLDSTVYTVPERVGLVYPRLLATTLTPRRTSSTSSRSRSCPMALRWTAPRT